MEWNDGIRSKDQWVAWWNITIQHDDKTAYSDIAVIIMVYQHKPQLPKLSWSNQVWKDADICTPRSNVSKERREGKSHYLSAKIWGYHSKLIPQ